MFRTVFVCCALQFRNDSNVVQHLHNTCVLCSAASILKGLFCCCFVVCGLWPGIMLYRGKCQNPQCFRTCCRTRRRDDAGTFRCDAPVRAAVRGCALLKARARAARLQQERNTRAAQHRTQDEFSKLAKRMLQCTETSPVSLQQVAEALLKTSQGCDGGIPVPNTTTITPLRTCQARVLPGHTSQKQQQRGFLPGASSSFAGLEATGFRPDGLQKCHGPWHGVPACDGIHHRLSQVCRQVVTKLMHNKDCPRPRDYEILLILATSCRLWSRVQIQCMLDRFVAAVFLSLGANLEGLFEGFFSACVEASCASARSFIELQAKVATRLGSRQPMMFICFQFVTWVQVKFAVDLLLLMH